MNIQVMGNFFPGLPWHHNLQGSKLTIASGKFATSKFRLLLTEKVGCSCLEILFQSNFWEVEANFPLKIT